MAKILLAEDDEFLRDIYHETLKDEGFDVTLATNGKEALEKIKEGGWDVVLLDVVMPIMNGVEVLHEVKENNPKSLAKHILFMTNSEYTKDLKDVIEMTDGYLLKSAFTPGQLVEK